MVVIKQIFKVSNILFINDIVFIKDFSLDNVTINGGFLFGVAFVWLYSQLHLFLFWVHKVLGSITDYITLFFLNKN